MKNNYKEQIKEIHKYLAGRKITSNNMEASIRDMSNIPFDIIPNYPLFNSSTLLDIATGYQTRSYQK